MIRVLALLFLALPAHAESHAAAEEQDAVQQYVIDPIDYDRCVTRRFVPSPNGYVIDFLTDDLDCDAVYRSLVAYEGDETYGELAQMAIDAGYAKPPVCSELMAELSQNCGE